MLLNIGFQRTAYHQFTKERMLICYGYIRKNMPFYHCLQKQNQKSFQQTSFTLKQNNDSFKYLFGALTLDRCMCKFTLTLTPPHKLCGQYDHLLLKAYYEPSIDSLNSHRLHLMAWPSFAQVAHQEWLYSHFHPQMAKGERLASLGSFIQILIE